MYQGTLGIEGGGGGGEEAGEGGGGGGGGGGDGFARLFHGSKIQADGWNSNKWKKR